MNHSYLTLKLPFRLTIVCDYKQNIARTGRRLEKSKESTPYGKSRRKLTEKKYAKLHRKRETKITRVEESRMTKKWRE